MINTVMDGWWHSTLIHMALQDLPPQLIALFNGLTLIQRQNYSLGASSPLALDVLTEFLTSRHYNNSCLRYLQHISRRGNPLFSLTFCIRVNFVSGPIYLEVSVVRGFCPLRGCSSPLLSKMVFSESSLHPGEVLWSVLPNVCGPFFPQERFLI